MLTKIYAAMIFKRFILFLFLGVLIGLVSGSLYAPAFAQSGWAWYKTDLHVHSVLSADAFDDLGIQSQAAKALGYNALFLTDHNLASSFPISSLTANNMLFEDSYTHWTVGTYGSPASTTNALASTLVHTGTKSLHLASTASGSGETYAWTKRGPNFRSGDIILKVSIYPTRIDPGSGVYVSVSIGGDVTVDKPDGYTTAGGIISPGKSIVLVWQLGSARQSSSDPNRRVLTYPLTYTLNTWNTYTIDVSSALADIPSADLPLSYNAVTYLKMAAAANGGTANAYFDTYSITPSAPVPAADEFVYRNSVIHTFDTSTFKIFPSVEMGISKHAQRFNFGITDPAQFVSYVNGIDGILPAQQSGYPAMLNHPGSSGGVSDTEATSTQGEGADLMEVRQQGWINDWDAILVQKVQLLGTGTTDTHRVFSGSSYATYVYSSALAFDLLVHSIFEGRTYVAMGSFGDQSRVIFNLDSGSQEPYPARYPVYVPSTRSSVNVHLSVTGGLQSGDTVKWIRNGALLATDTVAGASYETTKAISLGGSWTYVRAEVRDSSGGLKALTQPIVFITVSGLPVDKSYYIDSVTTANNRNYTKLFVKGITTSGWDATGEVLTLTLNNPANTLVDLRLRTGVTPQSVQVDGAFIPVADSLATFQAASGSMWYYNSANALLYLKVLQATDISNVSITFASIGTITPTLTGTPTSTATSTSTPTPTSTPTSTPPSSAAIQVWLGGGLQDSFSLGKGQSLALSYPVSNGAVKLVSTNGMSLVGSEPVIYPVNGVNASFSEMLALSDKQLDTSYWLPWYNNVDLDTQLRFGNVSSSSATVQVWIGGVERKSGCTPSNSPYTLAPGASLRVSCAGINNGPVQIQSTQKIVAAERVIYRVNNTPTSFSEMMALPNGQLDSVYWLPWYNNVDLDTQLRFGNVSGTQATVRVWIGGQEISGCTPTNVPYPYVLGAGQSLRVSCAGINNGPVQIQSTQKIVAAERVIYRVNNMPTSFSETMALPASQLGQSYWLPWYDNAQPQVLDTQLRVGNVSASPATVRVYIGGVEMAGSPFSLAVGASLRQSFPVSNGPVQISSNVPIVVAERVVYKANGTPTSFTELLGLSSGQLDTASWLPWYNNLDLHTQLRLAVP